MSFNIDFTVLADQNPWVNSAVTQSNPNSSQILSGKLAQISNLSNNSLNAVTPVSANRRLIYSASAPNYIGWNATDSNNAPSIYVNYIDSQNHVRVLFDRPGTTLRLILRKVIAGTVTISVLIASLADTYFANTTLAFVVTGQAVGSDYQVSTTLDGTTYTTTLTGYTATGIAILQVFRQSTNYGSVSAMAIEELVTEPDYTQRKGSTFDATHTLGTITTATLNAVDVFDHVSSQAAGTVSFTGAVTDERTTSGVVDLVLGDGATTETYTVQVNVIGLPVYTLNKAGNLLGNLTGIKVLVTATGELDGTQLFTANTLTATAGVLDSGIYPNTGAVADVVTVSILTSAGDGITFSDALVLL
jgi:hypothetical protein